jgi:hypothetical protein
MFVFFAKYGIELIFFILHGVFLYEYIIQSCILVLKLPDILLTNYGFGRKSPDILLTNYGFGRKLPDILLTNYGLGRKLPDILLCTYVGILRLRCLMHHMYVIWTRGCTVVSLSGDPWADILLYSLSRFLLIKLLAGLTFTQKQQPTLKR